MIRIGPAGWSYKDWRGVVYPNDRPRGFDELAYISGFFDTVEINSSFYGPPRPTAAKKWLQSISANDRFRFTAKLFHSFTHERKPAPLDEKEFKDGIAALAEGNRLGALLAQFPWSFKNDGENRRYLVDLRRKFDEYPLVLEVRHSSWMEEDVLDLLVELGIAICNIDQPLFKRSVRPSALVTAPVGYVRLHGRNYKSWFSKTADVRERYDHLYSVDELEPWVARSKEIAEQAQDTYVITNNHYLGKAVVNAVEISTILRGKPQAAPAQLIEHYPELRDFAGGSNGQPSVS